MKSTYHYCYTFLGLTGLCVYLLQKQGVLLPYLIQNYYNDLIIMPLVLWIVELVLTYLKGKKTRPSFRIALVLALYYSLYFEWYLPKHHPRYTGDYLDVLCYFLGASFYKCIDYFDSKKH